MDKSRQNSALSNHSQSQSTVNSTNAKEKTGYSKADSKLKQEKHDKQSSSSTGHILPLGVGNSGNSTVINMSKRKGTSFQITSVSVSSATQQQQQQQHLTSGRHSTDNNGDDSADDLDDSHTDDNISRITDYETPSISETFSGEDVFFASQNAFGTAPVIPTSSQYGLAIVGPPDLGGNGSNLSAHVSVIDPSIMGPISSKQDADHKNERFKVVKIESTEPFKRGRWMCMDYLDHTTLQAQEDDGIDGNRENEENVATKDESEGNETANAGRKLLVVNNGEIDHNTFSDNEELDHEVNKINSSSSARQHHSETMTSIPTHIDHSNNIQVAHSMPQGQIEKIVTQEKLAGSYQGSVDSSGAPSQQSNAQASQSIGGGSANQSHYVEQQHAQTMTQEMLHSAMVHEQQLQPNFYHQGATLPTNFMTNLGHDSHTTQFHHHQQSQQQHNLNSPNSSSNANVLPISNPQQQQQLTTPNPIQQNVINITENSLNSGGGGGGGGENEYNNQDSMTSQFQNPQIVAGDRMQTNESNDNNPQAGNTVTNENISSSDNNNNIAISHEVSSPSSSAGTLGTVAEGGASEIQINESASNIVNSSNSATVGSADDTQTLNEDNERIFLKCSKKASGRNNEHRSHYLPHQHVKDNQKFVAQSLKSSDMNGLLTMTSSNDCERNLSKNSIITSNTQIINAEQKRNDNVVLEPEYVGNRKKNNPNLLLFDQYSTKTSSKKTKTVASKCIACAPGGLTATALNMNLSSIGPLCTNIGCINTKEQNSSTRVSRSASPALGNNAEHTSASGTSAVAIDNKIEQAMDLVKSHLMFAVREEVEVLKEKIAELMDRINQLEVENTILKANASQETLSQLTTAATVVVSPQPTAVVATASPIISQIPPQQLQTQLSAPSQAQSTVPAANNLPQATVQVANISPNQPAS